MTTISPAGKRPRKGKEDSPNKSTFASGLSKRTLRTKKTKGNRSEFGAVFASLVSDRLPTDVVNPR